MRFSLASQVRTELESAWGGYPDYVYSGEAPSARGHVPVFVYHTIGPSRFEKDLCFLAENGYRTLGMNDLVRHLRGQEPAPGDAVVLTFDDARSSFWRFGYPLLRRYRMKGVLFVIAGLTRDTSPPRDNLFAVWNGDRTRAELDAIDPDDATLCTWPELSEMHDSGWVEVESHSLFHREVFVGTEIVDFLGPGSNFVPFHSPATAYLTASDVGRGLVPDAYYGLPLFRTAPLHKGVRAWELSEELKQAARACWRDVPAEMREKGTWRRSLRARWKKHRFIQGLRRQSELEVERDLIEDIAGARALIKERVDRNAGDHFCLPYAVGSAVSLRCMKKVGVESCSWGTVAEERHNRTGSDPMRISRVKADFLWRLPGAGQKSLLHVYGKKIGRRLRGERVF